MWTFCWFLTGVWAGWKIRENANDDLADRGDQLLQDGTDDALAKILAELGPESTVVAKQGITPSPTERSPETKSSTTEETSQ